MPPLSAGSHAWWPAGAARSLINGRDLYYLVPGELGIFRLPTLVRSPVALWIHGHTHTAFDYTVDGTRVVCNPRGYLDRRTRQPENPQFAWDKVVEI